VSYEFDQHRFCGWVLGINVAIIAGADLILWWTS